MAEIVLVTGGCRSGKSAYAQRLAEARPPGRLFVATSPVTDEEMRQRIQAHQRDREGRGWETIEEPVALATVLREAASHTVVLVDCVSLWINNLLYHAEQAGRTLDEAHVADQCREVLAATREYPGPVIFVTNEVGLGVVPEHAVARRYRDLLGRANQTLAAQADAVTLVVCGIPWQLKTRPSPGMTAS